MLTLIKNKLRKLGVIVVFNSIATSLIILFVILVFLTPIIFVGGLILEGILKPQSQKHKRWHSNKETLEDIMLGMEFLLEYGKLLKKGQVQSNSKLQKLLSFCFNYYFNDY